jgi:hypothetical protein
MIVLRTSVWGCRFCCFMRRRRWWWWAWWWGWNIWCLLRMRGCKFFCFLGLGVGGEYFVYLPDVGMERVGVEEEEEE